MYSNIALSQCAYRSILSHLVEIEERKDDILDDLYCHPSALRDEFYYFLRRYLQKLEELIQNTQIVDSANKEHLKYVNFLPYVIIGSTVNLVNKNSGKTHIFRIISPFDTWKSKIDLSYISALGKTLILRKPQDMIQAQIDKNLCTYQIKSIRYE